MNGELDEFHRLRLVSEKMVQSGSRLPGMTELLRRQISALQIEHDLLQKLFEATTEQISRHSRPGISPTEFSKIGSTLEQLIELKSNFRDGSTGSFEKISQLIAEIMNAVQRDIKSTGRVIEASQAHASSRASYNYQGIKDRRRAALDQLKMLANSVESTTSIIKEYLNADRLAASKAGASKLEQLLKSALQAQRRNDLQGGIDAMEQAAWLAPDQPDIVCDLGMLYLDAGRISEAKKSLQTVLNLNPHSVKALLLSAKISGHENLFEAALAPLQEAKALTEDLEEKKKVLLELAYTYYRLGDIQSAESVWVEVLLTNPFEDEARRWLNLINPK